MKKLNMPKFYRLQLYHVAFFLLALGNFLLHYWLGNDFYWHLKAGELFYQTSSLPQGDPFSFTFAGEPWVMHEWLFEYLLYLLHSHAGIYGVKLFAATIITVSLYIVYRSAMALSQNKWLSLILAAAGFFILTNYALPRPQIFTYFFLSIYIYILIGYKYRVYPVRLYWLPLLMIVWVNMHGGYIIGIALLSLFVITELFERLFLIAPDHAETTQLRPVVIITLVCVLASLFNPYTYHHWFYPFQVMSMTSSFVINEWKSPDFHSGLHRYYLFFIFLFLFIRNFTGNRPKALEVIIPLFFVLMSFTSRRHIPIAILAVLPFFALAFQQAILSFKIPVQLHFLKRRGKTGKEGFATYEFKGKIAYLFNWILLLIIVTVSYNLHISAEKRIALYENYYKPVDAVEFIKKAGISGNIFNRYNYGGFLIYHLYPETKVFIDSRLDLYGDKFYTEYRSIIHAGQGWKKLLNKYQIDYILLNNSQPVVYRLDESKEFTLIFRNHFNSVYVRNSDKFKPIIKRYGKKYVAITLE